MDYLKGKDIAAIRLARFDNAVYVGYQIPDGFLAEEGVALRVLRELSAQHEDGSWAVAGTSYHDAFQFERLDTGRIIERHIPYLPGFSKGKHWTQDDMDSVVALVVNRMRIEHENMERFFAHKLNLETRARLLAAARASRVQEYASVHSLPISGVRTGARVVTIADGKVWTLALKLEALGAILLAWPGGGEQRVIPLTEEVMPYTAQAEKDVKRL